MSEHDTEPNPTQEAIDEEGPSDQPVDVGGWEEEPSTHAGEGGQSDDIA